MIHILTHNRDQIRGTVEVYLDVGLKDLRLTHTQQDYIKTSLASKRKVGAVVRQYGGTTLFSYVTPQIADLELRLITSLTGCLGATDPSLAPQSSPTYEGI